MKGVVLSGVRRALFAVLAIGAVACRTGEGVGTATGTLFVEGCREKAGGVAPAYDLKPTFFAGTPTEDICPPPGECPGVHTNRLLIRMQRTGNRVEVNDVLYVDVLSSVQVARCLRGWVDGGVPQWESTRLVINSDGTPTDRLFCDWSAQGGSAPDGGAPDGGAVDAGVVMSATRARINLSTEDYVRVTLLPLASCVEERVAAVALPGSFIDFEDFGNAMRPDLPPDMRGHVGNDFKVGFGERLRATFHLILGDARVIEAIKLRNAVPEARIGGVLDGHFDFDLDRSRASQAFP